MSLYYCATCKHAFLPEKTVTDGNALFCQKCHEGLINLGAESSRISLQAHLESQSPAEPVSPYTLTSTKQYTQPKHDPILMDCQVQLQANPLNTDALMTLATWHYSHNGHNEAVAILRHIMRIDPDYKPAHTLLSRLAAPTDDVTNIDVLEQIGLKHVASGNSQAAIAVFTKILDQDPTHRAAHRYLADSYSHIGDYESAILHLNQLYLYCPTNPHVLFNLAVAFYHTRAYDRAKSSLLAAQQCCNDPALSHDIADFLEKL